MYEELDADALSSRREDFFVVVAEDVAEMLQEHATQSSPSIILAASSLLSLNMDAAGPDVHVKARVCV